MTTPTTQDELTTALRSLARAFVPDGNNSLSDEVIDFIIKSTGVIEFISRHYTPNDAIRAAANEFERIIFGAINGRDTFQNSNLSGQWVLEEWRKTQHALNLDSGTETGK